MKSITFQVISDEYTDPRTTRVNLQGVPSAQVWNEADRVLTKRFGERIERINHAGRTVTLGDA